MVQDGNANPKPVPEHPPGLAQSLEELAAAFGAKQEGAPARPAAPGAAPGSPEAAVGSASVPGAPTNLDMIMRIPVTVQIVLGTATMPVANLAKLGRGAVVPLDRRVGEPVDVVVNGKVVARGEVVVVDEDNSRFGISLTEVLDNPGF
jgi:flagellar motor switch protein FliN